MTQNIRYSSIAQSISVTFYALDKSFGLYDTVAIWTQWKYLRAFSGGCGQGIKELPTPGR
jgi:hypothetical protein